MLKALRRASLWKDGYLIVIAVVSKKIGNLPFKNLYLNIFSKLLQTFTIFPIIFSTVNLCSHSSLKRKSPKKFRLLWDKLLVRSPIFRCWKVIIALTSWCMLIEKPLFQLPGKILTPAILQTLKRFNFVLSQHRYEWTHEFQFF